MQWKRTEIRIWKLIRPAKPFFQKHYDGEVATYYFGKLVVSHEHWYEKSAEQSVQRIGLLARIQRWLAQPANR